MTWFTWLRQEFAEEYPDGARKAWQDWLTERKRWRSLSSEDRQLELMDREANMAYMKVLESPPDPQIAGALMAALHGENLVRVETNNVLIVAILNDGRALEYDALGRLLTRK